MSTPETGGPAFPHMVDVVQMHPDRSCTTRQLTEIAGAAYAQADAMLRARVEESK